MQKSIDRTDGVAKPGVEISYLNTILIYSKSSENLASTTP